jgi:hypothetical protein
MKAIIFSILISSAAMVSFAQKFEFGLNMGAAYSNISSLKYYAPYYSSIYGFRSNGLAPFASVKALYHRHNWQYGLSLEYAFLSYKRNASPWDPPIIIPETITIATPALPVKALINRQFKCGHFQSYVGISAGYIFVTSSQDPDLYGSATGDGRVIGIQLGSTYFTSKRFGINAEIAGNYMALNIRSVRYELLQFPFTVGIRYKL